MLGPARAAVSISTFQKPFISKDLVFDLCDLCNENPLFFFIIDEAIFIMETLCSSLLLTNYRRRDCADNAQLTGVILWNGRTWTCSLYGTWTDS